MESEFVQIEDMGNHIEDMDSFAPIEQMESDLVEIVAWTTFMF